MMRWLSLYSTSRSSAIAPTFSSTYAKLHYFSTQGQICVQPASLLLYTTWSLSTLWPIVLSLQQLSPKAFQCLTYGNTAALWHGKRGPPHCCAQPRAPWQTPRARPPPP